MPVTSRVQYVERIPLFSVRVRVFIVANGVRKYVHDVRSFDLVRRNGFVLTRISSHFPNLIWNQSEYRTYLTQRTLFETILRPD